MPYILKKMSVKFRILWVRNDDYDYDYYDYIYSGKSESYVT